MTVAPYVFKSRAMRALKGNWQTALLVSFCASLPATVVQLLQNTRLPNLALLTTYDAMNAAVNAITPETWFTLGLAGGIALFLTPALAVGRNSYFIRRIRGEEPGFLGLFARMGSFGKALLLYLVMAVKVALWSLLLVVPGFIAMLRYSMAPYYLAEHPEISIWEALRLSKQAMKTQKLNYFILFLSFMGWLLAALLSEMLLDGISVILGLVASQFIQLYMVTYLNASCAVFYLAVSSPDGISGAQADANAWLRSIGAIRNNGSDESGKGDSSDENAKNGDSSDPS
jgi:uncharacterized membrane protein